MSSTVTAAVAVGQALQRLGFVCRRGAMGRTRALFQQDRWELEVYVHGSGPKVGQWELVPWVGRRTRGIGADSLRRAVADHVGLERVLEQRLYEAAARLTANGQEDRVEGLMLAWEGWLHTHEPHYVAEWAAIQAEWDTEQQV